jgi:ribosomal protein S27E
MGYRFQCAHCHADVTVQFLKPGDEAQCPSCGKLTTIPAGAESTAGEKPVAVPERELAIFSLSAESDPRGLRSGPGFGRMLMSFAPIRDREHALALVRDCGWGFLILGASWIAFGALVWRNVPYLSIAYLLLGAAVLRCRASWAAQTLLVVSAIGLVFAVRLVLAGAAAVHQLVVPALFVWTAVRAVEATHKLRTRFASQERTS